MKFTDTILDLINKNTGYTAILFAAINISLGIFYAVLHWLWIIVWFGFLGASLLIYIAMETKLYMNYSKTITERVLNNNQYDSNLNLNESKTNLSLNSRHNLTESRYSISNQQQQPHKQHKQDRESSFTTINSFSPQIKSKNFDQQSYTNNLKNEKKILNKIQQRSENMLRKSGNLNDNFEDDVINFSNSDSLDIRMNRNLNSHSEHLKFSNNANLRY